jgi:hypothetical protein
MMHTVAIMAFRPSAIDIGQDRQNRFPLSCSN